MRDVLGRFIKGQHYNIATEFNKDMVRENNPNWKGGRPKCISCGKELFYGHIRCQVCHNTTKKGAGNPNWKGGKTDLILAIRLSKRYKQWRSDIFQRDNWTCQTCGKRGCYLEAHHIKRLADIFDNPKKLWDLDNGVTLCKECHEFTKIKDSKGKYAAQSAKAPGA